MPARPADPCLQRGGHAAVMQVRGATPAFDLSVAPGSKRALNLTDLGDIVGLVRSANRRLVCALNDAPPALAGGRLCVRPMLAETAPAALAVHKGRDRRRACSSGIPRVGLQPVGGVKPNSRICRCETNVVGSSFTPKVAAAYCASVAIGSSTDCQIPGFEGELHDRRY